MDRFIGKSRKQQGAEAGSASGGPPSNQARAVVSVKFCKKGIGGMRLDEIKRFMGRVKGGGEATSLSWVSGLS